jgi:hypothetical protein
MITGMYGAVTLILGKALLHLLIAVMERSARSAQ